MTVINIQWLNSRVSQWVEKIQDAAFLFSYPYVSKYAFTKRFGTLESKNHGMDIYFFSFEKSCILLILEYV